MACESRVTLESSADTPWFVLDWAGRGSTHLFVSLVDVPHLFFAHNALE